MSRIKYLTVFAVVLVGVVVGAYIYSYAPSSNQQIPNLPLENTKWRLVKTKYWYDLFTFDLKPRVGRPGGLSLTFHSDGRLDYKCTCNGSDGKFETNGKELKILAGGLTEMACGYDSSYDYACVKMLDSVSSYTYTSSDSLILHLKSSGAKMFFKQNSKL